MKYVRTPDSRFEDLPDFAFEPNYVFVPDHEGGELRMHYVDEGPADAEIILCLHGQPTWSYLYRHMIPLVAEAGLRVLAPDMIGFGRSDKPDSQEDYSFEKHLDWLEKWLLTLDLDNITLGCRYTENINPE